MHTRIDSLTHTHIHTHTQTNAHAHKRSHTRAYTHKCARSHAHWQSPALLVLWHCVVSSSEDLLMEAGDVTDFC